TQYFRAADIGVLPLTASNVKQRNGAIALKLWDYMAAGLPVVVTDFPSTPSASLLADKAAVVPPEDPDAMAKAFADLLGSTSERGRQPMTNEDGSLHLVVNGEIYNYVDLRAELQARGHSFRSHSDSEVVLHLYEEYGEDCMQRLEGMFALALWDAPRRSLLLARDRFGIKPLYVAQQGEALYFASELAAIRHGGNVAADIDPQAVYAYMALSYVPAPF